MNSEKFSVKFRMIPKLELWSYRRQSRSVSLLVLILRMPFRLILCIHTNIQNMFLCEKSIMFLLYGIGVSLLKITAYNAVIQVMVSYLIVLFMYDKKYQADWHYWKLTCLKPASGPAKTAVLTCCYKKRGFDFGCHNNTIYMFFEKKHCAGRQQWA